MWLISFCSLHLLLFLLKYSLIWSTSIFWPMHKIIIITNAASATTIVIKIAYSAPTMFQVLHKNRCHLLFPVTLWIHVMDGTMIVSWTGQFKVTSIRKKKKCSLGLKDLKRLNWRSGFLRKRISNQKGPQEAEELWRRTPPVPTQALSWEDGCGYFCAHGHVVPDALK